MVTGGIVEYDAGTATYRLPPEHAAVPHRSGPMNMAPSAQLQHPPRQARRPGARCFRDGGGVPYAAVPPEFTDVMDGMGSDGVRRGCSSTPPPAGARPAASEFARRAASPTSRAAPATPCVLLGSGVPGLDVRRLRPRRRGHRARRRRGRRRGLDNVSFEVRDVAKLASDEPFDAVFVFDAIHDQVDPAVRARPDPRGARRRRDVRDEGAHACRATSRTTSATRSRRSSTPSARCTA